MVKTTLSRKEFEHLFLPYTENGKQIWVITKVKELPVIIVNMALQLAALDFIRYIRIGNESLAASTENYPNRPKVPVTEVDHPTAVGMEILYNVDYKYIDFFSINSPVKGNGSKMVDSVLTDFPTDWQAAVVMDWSGGFWDKMEQKHTDCNWMLQ